MNETLLFRVCEAEHIMPLRARVLRAGKPLETAKFPEDQLEGTSHYCAELDHCAIACLSLISRDQSPLAVFQLRGMAVDTTWQVQGVGKRLLRFSEQTLQKRYPGALIWCNVRKAAIDFYKKAGYAITSEPFDIPCIGPHVVMQKQLAATMLPHDPRFD